MDNLKQPDGHYHHHTFQSPSPLATSSLYAYDNLAYQSCVGWDYDVQHEEEEEEEEVQQAQDAESSHRNFGFLETIEEETSDEVEVSDYSGVWCWGDDLTDGADSVIHVVPEAEAPTGRTTPAFSGQQAQATDVVLAYLESLVNHAQDDMDQCVSSGEESFSSWSDAIDAYLMSLANSGEAQGDLAGLVGPSASTETREAIRNLILRELEAAEFVSSGNSDDDVNSVRSQHKGPKSVSSRSRLPRLVGVRSAPDLTDCKQFHAMVPCSSRGDCDKTVHDLTAFAFDNCGQSTVDEEDMGHRSQSEPCISKMDYWTCMKSSCSSNRVHVSVVASRGGRSRSLDCSECSSTCSNSSEDVVTKCLSVNSGGTGGSKSFGSLDKLNCKVGAPVCSDDLSEDSGYSDLGYYLATKKCNHQGPSSCSKDKRQEKMQEIIVNKLCDGGNDEGHGHGAAVQPLTSRCASHQEESTVTTDIEKVSEEAGKSETQLDHDLDGLSTVTSYMAVTEDDEEEEVTPVEIISSDDRKRVNLGGVSAVVKQEEEEEEDSGEHREAEGWQEGGGVEQSGTSSAPWAKKHLQVGHSSEWEWEVHNSFLDSIQTTTPNLTVAPDTCKQHSGVVSTNNNNNLVTMDSSTPPPPAAAAATPPTTVWYMDFESPGPLDTAIFSVVDNPDDCLSTCADNEKWGGSQPNLDDEDKPGGPGRRSAAYYRRSFSEDCLSSSAGDQARIAAMSTLHDVDWWGAERVSDNSNTPSSSSACSSIACNSTGSPVELDSSQDNQVLEDKKVEEEGVCHAKPPLPPHRVVATRSKVIDARQRYFTKKLPPSVDMATTNNTSSEEDEDMGKRRSHIQETLQGYRQRAQIGRERVARSVHDLSDIEQTFRGHARIDKRAWSSEATNHSSPRQSAITAGYIETDIDTLVSREVLDDWSRTNGHGQQEYLQQQEQQQSAAYKTRSLFNLVAGKAEDPDHIVNSRSVEFLLNEDNMANALPPENRLKMRAEAPKSLSEHELRVQRSLQNLDLPKWYVNFVQEKGESGQVTTRKSGSSASGLHSKPPRWQDVRNRPRQSSRENVLQSPMTPSRDKSPSYLQSYPSNYWRWSVGWIPTCSTPSRSESPSSAQSALVVPHSRSRASSTTSYMSQGQLRTPYLGWRTLKKPTDAHSLYDGPHERLSKSPGYYAFYKGGSSVSRPSSGSESSLNGDKPMRCRVKNDSKSSTSSTGKHDDVFNSSVEQVEEIISATNPQVDSSIKEVVRQIGNLVSYDHHQQQQQEASDHQPKSTESSPKSPRQRVIWVESSFVGARQDRNSAKSTTGEVAAEAADASDQQTHGNMANKMDAISRTVTTVMDEMDATDPHHAVPYQSGVDLGEMLDSLLGLTGGRSQSNSRSPSPAGSVTPPPLPMQPPPSATVARIYDIMFEPGDNSIPPKSPASNQGHDITFQLDEIITSSPKLLQTHRNRLDDSSVSSSSSVEMGIPGISIQPTVTRVESAMHALKENLTIQNSGRFMSYDVNKELDSSDEECTVIPSRPPLPSAADIRGYVIPSSATHNYDSTSDDDLVLPSIDLPPPSPLKCGSSLSSIEDTDIPAIPIKQTVEVEYSAYHAVHVPDEETDSERFSEYAKRLTLSTTDLMAEPEVEHTTKEVHFKEVEHTTKEVHFKEEEPSHPNPPVEKQYYTLSHYKKRHSSSDEDDLGKSIKLPQPDLLTKEDNLKKLPQPSSGPTKPSFTISPYKKDSSSEDEQKQSELPKSVYSIKEDMKTASKQSSGAQKPLFTISHYKKDSSSSDEECKKSYVKLPINDTKKVSSHPVSGTAKPIFTMSHYKKGDSSDADELTRHPKLVKKKSDHSISSLERQSPILMKPTVTVASVATASILHTKPQHPTKEEVILKQPSYPSPVTAKPIFTMSHYKKDLLSDEELNRSPKLERSDSDSSLSSLENHNAPLNFIKENIIVEALLPENIAHHPLNVTKLPSAEPEPREKPTKENIIKRLTSFRGLVSPTPLVTIKPDRKASYTSSDDDLVKSPTKLPRSESPVSSVETNNAHPVSTNPNVTFGKLITSSNVEVSYPIQGTYYKNNTTILSADVHSKGKDSSDEDLIESITELLPPVSESSSSSPEIQKKKDIVVSTNAAAKLLSHKKSGSSSSICSADAAPISRAIRPGNAPPPPPSSTPPPSQPLAKSMPLLTSVSKTNVTQGTEKTPLPTTLQFSSHSSPKHIYEKNTQKKAAKVTSNGEELATELHSQSEDDKDSRASSSVVLRRRQGERRPDYSHSRMTTGSTTTETHSLASTRKSLFMGSMPELTCNRRSLIEAPLDESIIARCSYNFCANSAPIDLARKTYKTCHSCAAFYCSSNCRRSHWDRHRKQCMNGKVKLLLKQILKKVVDDKAVHNELSRIACAGFQSQERGFVKLIFRNSEFAFKFVKSGMKALEDFPIFVGWRDLLEQETGMEMYQLVTDLCKRYKPESRMVVLAAVRTARNVPTEAIPEWESRVTARCIKVRLSKSVIGNFAKGKGIQEEPYVMTVTGSDALTKARGHGTTLSPRKERQICFEGIQAQLWERGVRLQVQFPEEYEKLKAFVDHNDPFKPITIYPKDGRSGRTFTCLITPDKSVNTNSPISSQRSPGSDKSKDKTRF